MKTIFETIINSLNNTPQDWWLGDSFLNHKSGLRIGWCWDKERDIIPLMGNLWIESVEEPKVYRFFKRFEKDDFMLFWKKVVECQSAEALKDKILINLLK